MKGNNVENDVVEPVWDSLEQETGYHLLIMAAFQIEHCLGFWDNKNSWSNVHNELWFYLPGYMQFINDSL